jgi:CheY-like chemotaxis protein
MLELSALRVLLVDDEAFNRESVRLCLNSRGFKA